nr:MAG TPA: hypothetical protein [Caudoviricetes sp.]
MRFCVCRSRFCLNYNPFTIFVKRFCRLFKKFFEIL